MLEQDQRVARRILRAARADLTPLFAQVAASFPSLGERGGARLASLWEADMGDARWLDQKGSYMATIAAGAVYKLLGAKDLGVSNDYKTEKMPPMLTDMLNGELAWRQHDGGHTDGPNFKHFIPWATRLLKYERKDAQ